MGLLECGFGVDRIEIDEPRLEQCPRHLLQCLVHASVEFNFVVERAEDVGDGALFGERREV